MRIGQQFRSPSLDRQTLARNRPGERHPQETTWGDEKYPDGRLRVFDYENLANGDKLNLDVFWLRDETLEDGDNLPKPYVLAGEITDDLEAALEQFRAVASKLGKG